jgi:hyaluronoglucosaminidase
MIRILVAALLAAGTVGLVAAPAAGATSHDAAAALPAVRPTPQQVTERAGAIPIPPAVTEVVGTDTDPAALTALAAVLRADGARTITQVTAGSPAPRGPLTIVVGTPSDNSSVTPALDALDAQGPAGLPSGGYVLASGDGEIVLAGADATGTYYAVDTLRQLITHRTLRDVVVRDWPSVPVRGVIEGFYGPTDRPGPTRRSPAS